MPSPQAGPGECHLNGILATPSSWTTRASKKAQAGRGHLHVALDRGSIRLCAPAPKLLRSLLRRGFLVTQGDVCPERCLATLEGSFLRYYSADGSTPVTTTCVALDRSLCRA
jgi:hypothetical protein